MNLQKLANAVACSIAVLEGTGGGYSPDEKMKAKITLMEFNKILMSSVVATLSNSE